LTPQERSSADMGCLLRAGRDPLAAVLRRTLRERCGFTGGGAVLAVSGGGDSMALLHLAAALQQQEAGLGEFTVVHVDHRLRSGSGDEGNLVAARAAALGLRCERRSVECGKPPGVAARARRERYRILAEVAREIDASAVVTAHHADDQLENLLIALGRGRGLSGMAWSRRLAAGVRLLRPLLAVTRAELRSCCARLEVPFCEDPGNLDPSTLRGRLRMRVTPSIEAIWPGSVGRAASVAESSSLGEMAIERWLAESFGPSACRSWARPALAALPAALRARGLRRALHAADPKASQRLRGTSVEIAAAAIGDGTAAPRRWAWPDGWALRIAGDEVRLCRDDAGSDSIPGPPAL
jgi:tRNA(Ile)-lysidine synthase